MLTDFAMQNRKTAKPRVAAGYKLSLPENEDKGKRGK